MGIKKTNYNLLIFIFSIIVLNSYILFNICKTNNVKDSTFRFHVVANSNSISDQITKLKVSAKLEEFINTLNLENKSSDEIYKSLYDNSKKIIEISDNTLKNEDVNYKSKLNIGKIYYTESKDSPLIHMSDGCYNSIQIVLGNGEGKNFWGLIDNNLENIEKLENLSTILPEINLFHKNLATNQNANSNKIEYKSLLVEFINAVKSTTTT